MVPSATIFEPLIIAQSVPFTVAQPPRMPLALFVAEVVNPLEPLIVPVGWVKFTVLPALRVIAPRFSRSGLDVALALSVIWLFPAFKVSPLKVWLLAAPAEPVRVSVPPPPSVRAELPLRMLPAGAPAAEKFSVRPPPLIVVGPV